MVYLYLNSKTWATEQGTGKIVLHWREATEKNQNNLINHRCIIHKAKISTKIGTNYKVKLCCYKTYSLICTFASKQCGSKIRFVVSIRLKNIAVSGNMDKKIGSVGRIF